MRAESQDARTVPVPSVRAIPSHWQAQGRLAAIRPHEAWNVSFDWRQAGADYRIELQGPFGQGAARIEGTEERVSIHMADGQTHTSDDPESLLAAQLGWRTPVGALRYWLAGQPRPDLPVSDGKSDAAGRWQAFHQAGWRIEYTEFHNVAASPLPRRLRLEQDDLSVRIVITAWTL
jgi:outer membrane lipoprotein LolB